MNKFAAFDIDGTLIRWQLYHTIVDKLAKAGQLGANARSELKQARMRWKRREPGYSFTDYERTLITIYENALPGLDPMVFDALIAEVINEYKDQVYTYTRDLCADLKNKGYKLLAISGSHEELVAEIAKHYGFDDWCGTKYERSNGGFTGSKFIASHNKQEILTNLIAKHNLTAKNSYAIGDSQSDIPMLQMVQNPIAFNPNQELYNAAKQNGWQIVIERKNVVYELTKTKTNYELAD